MTDAKDRQVNIRLNASEYAVLQDIAARAEFKTSAQAVAGTMLKRMLAEELAKYETPPITRQKRRQSFTRVG